jgi:hypothetical protein
VELKDSLFLVERVMGLMACLETTMNRRTDYARVLPLAQRVITITKILRVNSLFLVERAMALTICLHFKVVVVEDLKSLLYSTESSL